MLWVTGWMCGELRLGEAALNLGQLGVLPLKNTSLKPSKILTSLSSFQSVQKNPLKIQIRYNQTRVAFLQQFPYGVHFNIIENEIIIVAVFNTSQSPKKWSIR